MAYMIVTHKVQDFDKWKIVFDEHSVTRKANGGQGGYLFRSDKDPNEVVVVLKWDDITRARQFAKSDDLKYVMQKAGVIGQPDIYFFQDYERVSF